MLFSNVATLHQIPKVETETKTKAKCDVHINEKLPPMFHSEAKLYRGQCDGPYCTGPLYKAFPGSLQLLHTPSLYRSN